MGRHADRHGHEVDVRVGVHLVVVVVGQLHAESLGGALGGVFVGGADRLQLIVRQRLQRRDVGPRAPATGLGVGADDADADLLSHDASSSTL